MKRINIFILFIFIINNIHAITTGDAYIYSRQWYANTGNDINSEITGEVKILLHIAEVINNDTILIELSEDFTPFDSFSIRVEAVYKNGGFIFQFNDGWGNIIDGRLDFEGDEVALLMNCVKYTFLGKQHGRLYGGPFILRKMKIE
jgi:hypothetical protein